MLQKINDSINKSIGTVDPSSKAGKEAKELMKITQEIENQDPNK